MTVNTMVVYRVLHVIIIFKRNTFGVRIMLANKLADISHQRCSRITSVHQF
jgi:hypothetical protein